MWSRCIPGRREGSSRAMLATARPSCFIIIVIEFRYRSYYVKSLTNVLKLRRLNVILWPVLYFRGASVCESLKKNNWAGQIRPSLRFCSASHRVIKALVCM